MTPMYHKFSRASSVEEIVSLTRDYLADWSPEDFEKLPAGCRPAWVRSASDIEEWADRLSTEAKKSALLSDDERQLEALTNHFLIASVILRQIESRRCAS